MDDEQEGDEEALSVINTTTCLSPICWRSRPLQREGKLHHP